MGAWNNKNLQFISRIANTTGFQQDTLATLFKGIAYGLGWIEEKDSSRQSIKPEQSSATSKNNANKKSYKKPDLQKILRSHKFIFTKGGKYGIMNYAGQIIHEAVYNEIDEYPSAGMISVRKGKLWGYIDSESSHSIEPQFNEVNAFRDGRALVKCNNISDNDYVINRDGDMVIPPTYDCILNFSYELACVVIDNMQGYIDIDGEIKVPIEYPFPPISVHTEHEILVNVEYGTKIIDKDNNLLAFFDEIYIGYNSGALGNGKFIVSQFFDDSKSKYGVIDTTSKIVIPCRYDDLSMIKDYGTNAVFIRAKLGKKYGVLSTSGKMLVPFQYDEIETQTSKNQFIAKKKGKWGIVDVDAKIVIPFMYDEISYIGENGYHVKLGSKDGIIDAYNEWIVDSPTEVPFSNDYEWIDTILDENENKIYLCHKGRSGYIFDEQGEELLKFNCPEITETIN